MWAFLGGGVLAAGLMVLAPDVDPWRIIVASVCLIVWRFLVEIDQ